MEGCFITLFSQSSHTKRFPVTSLRFKEYNSHSADHIIRASRLMSYKYMQTTCVGFILCVKYDTFVKDYNGCPSKKGLTTRLSGNVCVRNSTLIYYHKRCCQTGVLVHKYRFLSRHCGVKAEISHSGL